MIILVSFLSAAFAWQISGPERGHVLDADVGEHEILVVTRVGVMHADPELTLWERDSRFPPETKRVAVWKKGAWAAPPTQLWEIREDGSMHLTKEFPNSVIIDLDARDDGIVFVGVRGAQKGLWRIEPGGRAVQISSNLEPWTILTSGRDIWVGTLENGLWSSEQGQPFSQVSTGSVTAIEKVGSRVWIGYSDGQIIDAHTQEVVGKIEDGFASRIASLGQEKAFLTVASPRRKAHPFQVLNSAGLSDIGEVKVDDDAGFVGGTGAWSLRDGTAMVGTFRRGPLRWDGELLPDRNGFQAMVSTGAAIDQYGQLVMAFMGTGVYRWKDGDIYAHAAEGPVTDSIVVRSVLGQVAVLDFDGIKLLQEDGSWEGMPGIEDSKQRVHNSLRDIGRTDDGTWWAWDSQGHLWSRLAEEKGKEWQKCALRWGVRFDGTGADLQIVGKMGYFYPDCNGQQHSQLKITNIMESRAWGDWLAADGGLFYKNQKVEEIPEGKVDSMVKDGKGVLVSIREEALLYCEMECEEVAPAVSEPLIALGRLPDGRIWALEESGSLLIDDGTENIPPAWHPFTEHRVQFNSVMKYYSDPWINGTAGFEAPKFLRRKSYRFDYWMILSFIAIGLGIFLFRMSRKKG